MSDKLLPTFERYADFKMITGASEEDREEACDAIDRAGCELFLENNPNYYASRRNGELLTGFLTAHGVPTTRWNLEIAARELKDQLETAPAPEPETTTTTNVGIITSVSDVMAEYQPGTSEAAVLEKVKDSPELSDAERKRRDRRLAILARDQRLAIRRAGGVPWEE